MVYTHLARCKAGAVYINKGGASGISDLAGFRRCLGVKLAININSSLQQSHVKNKFQYPWRIHVWYIYATIWGILMVNVTIYGRHGSYGISFYLSFTKFQSQCQSQQIRHITYPESKRVMPSELISRTHSDEWRALGRCAGNNWFHDVPYMSGWWFGTFFIFPYIGNNHPNWLIFFRGVQTTNQML